MSYMSTSEDNQYPNYFQWNRKSLINDQFKLKSLHKDKIMKMMTKSKNGKRKYPLTKGQVANYNKVQKLTSGEYKRTNRIGKNGKDNKDDRINLPSEVLPLNPDEISKLVNELLDDKSIKPTEEQLDFVTRVLQRRNVFLTGSSWTGKKSALRLLTAALTKTKVKFAVTSKIADSAILLSGLTLDSWLNIPSVHDDLNTLLRRSKKNPGIAKKWRQIEVLIIDGISMCVDDYLSVIYHFSKYYRSDQNTRPVCGDAINNANNANNITNSNNTLKDLCFVFCGNYMEDYPISCSKFPSNGFDSDVWKLINPEKLILTKSFADTISSFMGYMNGKNIKENKESKENKENKQDDREGEESKASQDDKEIKKNDKDNNDNKEVKKDNEDDKEIKQNDKDCRDDKEIKHDENECKDSREIKQGNDNKQIRNDDSKETKQDNDNKEIKNNDDSKEIKEVKIEIAANDEYKEFRARLDRIRTGCPTEDDREYFSGLVENRMLPPVARNVKKIKSVGEEVNTELPDHPIEIYSESYGIDEENDFISKEVQPNNSSYAHFKAKEIVNDTPASGDDKNNPFFLTMRESLVKENISLCVGSQVILLIDLEVDIDNIEFVKKNDKNSNKNKDVDENNNVDENKNDNDNENDERRNHQGQDKIIIPRGTIGIVRGFAPTRGDLSESYMRYIPKVSFKNIIVTVHSHTWERIEEYEDATLGKNDVLKLCYIQLPLLLAWSVSLHAASNLQFERVFLRTTFIENCQQFYKVLCRVKDPNQLFLESFEDKFLEMPRELLKYYDSASTATASSSSSTALSSLSSSSPSSLSTSSPSLSILSSTSSSSSSSSSTLSSSSSFPSLSSISSCSSSLPLLSSSLPLSSSSPSLSSMGNVRNNHPLSLQFCSTSSSSSKSPKSPRSPMASPLSLPLTPV